MEASSQSWPRLLLQKPFLWEGLCFSLTVVELCKDGVSRSCLCSSLLYDVFCVSPQTDNCLGLSHQ